MVVLVTVIGLVFLVSALFVKPDLLGIMSGLFTPHLPEGSMVMIVSLIGTTVVPYNLFLHASSVKSRWSKDDLPLARLDTFVSVAGGGIITMAILITAAVAFKGANQDISSINDLSLQLVPLIRKLGPRVYGLRFSGGRPLFIYYSTTRRCIRYFGSIGLGFKP